MVFAGYQVSLPVSGHFTGVYFSRTAVYTGHFRYFPPSRSIKAIVPQGLSAGEEYVLKIVTQSSAHGHGTLLNNLWEVRSEFKLTGHDQA
jgi:hypothetical protein